MAAEEEAPWNVAPAVDSGLAARVERAQAELADLAAHVAEPQHPVNQRLLVWGAKVSLKFKMGVIWIEDQIGLPADFLMSCMAFESACTFSPRIKNAAGSGAVGLIQFMPSTALKMGTTTALLAAMTPEHQLSYVFRYFKAFGTDLRHWSLEDVYMAILLPKAIGKPLDWQMPWKYGSIAFKQNSGLDLNKDHTITKAEAAAGVKKMFVLGQQFKG
jgi:hypothetical protein